MQTNRHYENFIKTLEQGPIWWGTVRKNPAENLFYGDWPFGDTYLVTHELVSQTDHDEHSMPCKTVWKLTFKESISDYVGKWPEKTVYIAFHGRNTSHVGMEYEGYWKEVTPKEVSQTVYV